MDPDARHAHKTRERRQDGFKAHIVVEPDTGLTVMMCVVVLRAGLTHGLTVAVAD